jgi:hypothetical protein
MNKRAPPLHELSTPGPGYPQHYEQLEDAIALCAADSLRYNAAVPLDELSPSPELITAVTAERERLDQLVDALREEYAQLEEKLGAVGGRIEVATDRQAQLARFLGEDEGPERGNGTRSKRRGAKSRDGQLRGGAIREAAVRAMLTQDNLERPRHYREWLTAIEAAGQKIHGQDPAATLLTQLSRTPLIARASEPGTYRLDRDALRHLRQQRDALRAEADAKIVSTNDRDYDVIDLAQALAAVEASVKRIDRAITEAIKLVDRLDARWFFTDPDAPPASHEHSTAVAA